MIINKIIHNIYRKIKRNFKKILISFVIFAFLVCGILALWLSTLTIPDISSFETRKVVESTKIYDKTGKILLYDVHANEKRTAVPFNTISRNIKNATIAIEDAEFYSHPGIRITSLIRATLANIFSGGYSQGGSTITQQVVKNTLLTTDKTFSRKIKEIYLSLKIERIFSKDQILSIYLNETPYGGNIYGVEEASRTFFGKSSSDLSIIESAYLAAIPQAPTFYSPYGNNKDKLDARKNLVLKKMLDSKFITQEEYASSKKEKITFQPRDPYGILAPHFVEFVKQYLANKYGATAIEENGYKVITTLDYDIQAKAEAVVKEYALENAKNFNAENAALVAIDPRNGQILAMVGSRDYFDKVIDGQFNVAIANRQPGSTFKPFVYATAFEKGYTPDTVLFDIPTEFQSTCTPEGKPIDPSGDPNQCYMPEDYDGLYLGPMTLRDALAQSRNIPSIKTLYLAGIKDSLKTAQDMGITTLSNNPDQYGLTLVLGGGEVSPLDLTSAYGVFANNGIRNPYASIISITDKNGNEIEKYTPRPETVLDQNISSHISDILSDNIARTPAYGENSPLYFPGRPVASKTGTTNDYKDVWIVGYTPSLVVGAWAGNNNNSPMKKKVAGMIIAPMWRAFMDKVLPNMPVEHFPTPRSIDQNIKPILRGFWQGNQTYFIDKISGKLATDMTPDETKQEKSITNIHSILYWVDKNNPLGGAPQNPDNDYQFSLWEYSVQKWLRNNPIITNTPPTMTDDVHTTMNTPQVIVLSPDETTVYNKDTRITAIISISSRYTPLKANFYVNGEYIGESHNIPFNISFVPSEISSLQSKNELKIDAYDSAYNKVEKIITFNVN
ncbi:MAG: PBP1A family penicillin-binding protein [Minisyncoccia bacterium]